MPRLPIRREADCVASTVFHTKRPAPCLLARSSKCPLSMLSFALLAGLLVPTTAVLGASLADIEHIVFYMQENRAFDHYFGSLYGVRGFQDPNVQVNAATGRSVFYQQVNSTLSNATDYLLPWYLNAQGGQYLNGTQCVTGGSNSFLNNHQAYANGSNDMWALENSPMSVAYYTRQDIPIHYAIADAWTVGDMYQEAQMASTWPNRVHWMTGSINIPGGEVNSTQGPVLDNNDTPGCSHLTFTDYLTPADNEETTWMNVSCFPYDWKTVPEYLEDMGSSWFVYQANDNFGCNELAAFDIFINGAASPLNNTDNPLIVQGMSTSWDNNNDWQGGFTRFASDAAAGTLPQVSWIMPNQELSEHPPWTPRQGAWAQSQVINAVQSSPKYNNTILFISYDETGGWSDHVVPFHPPAGTPGEYLLNPLTNISTFSGPGFRLPFYVISPYTRGGNVFTEPSDHTSQLLFLEEWMAARGTPFTNANINPWRRQHMSNLLNMFDFSTPDSSQVVLPTGEEPFVDGLTGLLAGAEYCEAKYAGYIDPQVPFGLQTEAEALAVESGFRSVRGALTEGRYLVLESSSVALSANDGYLMTSAQQAEKQTDATQRFVVHALDSTQVDATLFTISTPGAAVYLTSSVGLGSVAQAATFNITYQSASTSHYLQETSSGMYLTLVGDYVEMGTDPAPFKLYSVTF